MHEVDVEALSPMDTAPLGTLGVLGYATLGQEIDAVARFVRTVIERHGVVGRTAGSEDSAKRSHGPHVAVLFRAKTAMPQFAQGLERAGLTTLTVGYSALLDRPEVRDVLALLHVIVDSTDTAALMRLLATPRFGISAAGLRALASIADDENTAYQFRSLVQAGLVSADTPGPSAAPWSTNIAIRSRTACSWPMYWRDGIWRHCLRPSTPSTATIATR